MVYSHFAIKTIDQELTGTGYIIRVTTDHKCHLWLRWTNIEPRKHITQAMERGAPIDLWTRYCFVSYHDNEQEEEGDTYDHTFIKEPWPACETRWFYFIGQVSASPSPSDSAIFIKHRVPPPYNKYASCIAEPPLGAAAIHGTNWKLQYFIAPSAHTITHVVLRLWKSWEPTPPYPVIAGIREYLGGGNVAQVDLCSGSISLNSLSHDQWGYYTTITFDTPHDLEYDKPYCIVVRCPTGTGGLYLLWTSAANALACPGGWQARSTDGGVTWTNWAELSMQYEEWGTPL